MDGVSKRYRVYYEKSDNIKYLIINLLKGKRDRYRDVWALSDVSLQVGRADGVNCRTVEMFEAFGLADKMIDEAYWVNETHFWGADPQDNSRIIRLGRATTIRPSPVTRPDRPVICARRLPAPTWSSAGETRPRR